MRPASASTYGQVLKSSTITGGSSAIGMLISLISVKGAATFLGPSGIGELRQYQAVLGAAGALFGLGLGPSAVRNLSHFIATGDLAAASRIVGILGRLTVLAGLVGWAALAATCVPLGQLAFDDGDHAAGIALAGAVVFFGSITAGYLALLQSRQRVADVAIARVSTSAWTAAVSIAFFWGFGRQGILPSLIASAVGGLVIHRRLVRRDAFWGAACPAMLETLRAGRDMAALGIAMMATSILAGVTGTVIGGLIVRELGMLANGLYSAAWGLSMLFAGFILAAMETDYFPRLSAVQTDPGSMKRVVNEQTEVGILLATPGVIGTMVLCPLALVILFSDEFMPAASLLPWLVIGVLGRVVCMPMVLILLARGRSRTFLTTEIVFAAAQLGLSAAGVHFLGLPGVAMAYAAQMWLYTLVMVILAHREIGMRWSSSVVKLIASTIALVVGVFAVRHLAGELAGNLVGLAILALAVLMSLRGLASRLGPRHRLVAPLLRWKASAWLLAGTGPNG